MKTTNRTIAIALAAIVLSGCASNSVNSNTAVADDCDAAIASNRNNHFLRARRIGSAMPAQGGGKCDDHS